MVRKMIESSRVLLGGHHFMNVNREKLLNTINQKWIRKECPLCGKNNWEVGNQMSAMMNVGEDKSVQVGGRFIPLVPIVCNECGNTILVNPLVIGCVDNLED